LDSISLVSPNDDSVSAVGGAIGHPNTVFSDSFGSTVAVHTSCSKCLYEGMLVDGWLISSLVERDDKLGTLAAKCSSSPGKDDKKKGKSSCISSISVKSPSNVVVTKVDGEVGHPNTLFEDGGDEVYVHTSCSKCLEVGMGVDGWTITAIVDNGDLAKKCR